MRTPSFLSRSLATLALFSLLGAGCTKGLSAEDQKVNKRLELNVWGVVDDEDAYSAVLTDYHRAHPNVTLNYRRLRLEEYEDELLNALAEDRGPDIFLIHHDWVGKYLSKISPMPPSARVAYTFTKGTVKPEQVTEVRTEPSITMKAVREQFADTIAKDAIRFVDVSTNPDARDFQERLLGAPNGIDTLALYYNKDLLNAAGIATPPENWGQFQEAIKKVTKVDAQGRIVQPGAGIGTGANVERSADLITALMMQNGTVMADPDSGEPMLSRIPAELAGRETPPAYQALEFYADFANPSKQTYTWDASQPNSLEAFIAGRAAFFFGYSYQQSQIRARAPKLNLGITKLPQIEGNPVKNVANYWLWVVSKKTKSIDYAWNFLNFFLKPEEMKKMLDVAKRPSPRRAMLADQLEDEQVGVFASQVLTASTWYRGKDPKTMEGALVEMIDSVVNGAPIPNAVQLAQEKIAQTLGN